jgi:hypothetical protein
MSKNNPDAKSPTNTDQGNPVESPIQKATGVDPLSNYLGISIVSALFQPFMTPAYLAMVMKQTGGKTYPEIFRTIIDGNVKGLLFPSLRMYKGRLKGPIFLNAFGKPLAEYAEIDENLFIALNALTEAQLYGQVEVVERFTTANRGFFPQIPEGINLATISKIEFDKYTQSYLAKNPANVSELKDRTFDELERRRDILKGNKLTQFAGLGLRNIVFLATAYKTKPLAAEVVDEYGAIFEKMGIKKDVQVEILTIFNRFIFAAVTTPFDRLVTEVSTGTKSVGDVFKSIDMKSLFRGAMARSVMVCLAATTVVEGLEFAKQINEFVKDDPLINFMAEKMKDLSSKYREDLNAKIMAKIMVDEQGQPMFYQDCIDEASQQLFALTCKDYDETIAQSSSFESLLVDSNIEKPLVTPQENIGINQANSSDVKGVLPKNPFEKRGDFRFLDLMTQRSRATSGCEVAAQQLPEFTAAYRRFTTSSQPERATDPCLSVRADFAKCMADHSKSKVVLDL